MNLLMLVQGIFAVERLGASAALILRVTMGEFMAPQVFLAAEGLIAQRALMTSHACCQSVGLRLRGASRHCSPALGQNSLPSDDRSWLHWCLAALEGSAILP